MAGTITHLVIADRILANLPPEIRRIIKNLSLYYCGNLAPDAVMARKGYVREMKKHTHFKDGIPEDELSVEENFKLYRGRLEAFAKRFLTEENPYFELYFGYVTHMLADEIFILTLRDRHVKELQSMQANPDYEKYFIRFGKDVDINDWRLLKEYKFSCDILEMIQRENDYEIKDMITNEELIKSKTFIINKNFLSEHKEETPVVLSYEENEAYIERAVEQITSALSQRSLVVTRDSSSSSAI